MSNNLRSNNKASIKRPVSKISEGNGGLLQLKSKQTLPALFDCDSL